VIGEPSGWDAVTVGYKGFLRLEVEVSRATSHSASAVQSAADELLGFWRQVQDHVEDFNAERQGMFEGLQATVRALRSHGDGQADHAFASSSFRLPPSVNPEQLQTTLSELLPKGSQATFSGQVPCHQSPRHGPLPAAFVHALKLQGRKPRWLRKTGTSDMNVVAPIWNCPIVAYGPGDSFYDHHPEEQLALGEFEQALEVLGAALREFFRRQGCPPEELRDQGGVRLPGKSPESSLFEDQLLLGAVNQKARGVDCQ
jgi:LysW-gamma-L-lysine carboxypeptidase